MTGDVVRAASIEVIPLSGARHELGLVPPGSTITITCSPRLGIGATLDLAEVAVAAGHRVVPHLAARQIRDDAELADVVARLRDRAVDDVFVIGGDADRPVGGFDSAGDLLEAFERGGHTFASVGVACYPEGHPVIPGPVLRAELLRKQRLADYMISQLCFDAAALVSWLGRSRDAGINLPLRIGIAAPLKARKLVELSMRIGVGSSLRFLTKQRGFVNNMLIGGRYEPEHLLQDVRRIAALDDLGISGLHIFSFNDVAGATAWQQQYQPPVSRTDPGQPGDGRDVRTARSEDHT
jgi:methylenetetrahydrofolate reductase (NADPH)